MSDTLFKSQIANHLKQLRQSQELSLDAAAKLTGVSKAMLGQIERQESSPTISTLWRIASGLNTSFSAFFADNPNLLTSEKTFPDDPKMKVSTLFPFREDVGFEVFEITLREYHQQMSSPHAPGVLEHILVTAGKLNVYFDDTWHTLLQGETIRFYSDQVHGYQALTETTTFQDIISYPKL
ncbi:helix-turn-helix domain-containing protein [Alteromonas sp. a30]|uniref:helix-turn-helix domain-containing protein n=1 Tax=Alteromonas sp. a30 TaxID=2730917 RepID=UPI00227D9A4B|nr:XRE family transcriptional regulator [Alteromonas sp. a30]MCY7294698.1 helix-turn-helix transcriptional regulator [Alteromonas sp. a30]